ncbi:VOC family protein [Rudaeicoccus suwonensis]|nr:VOC family protein [Rudaeicoccus suwonensis]
MTTRTTMWTAGTPCWVDCAFAPEHRGMHHARDFYGKLFGWHIEEGPEDTGGYLTCLKDDHAAAGLMPHMSEDQPTVWSTYLATDDVDATCNAVRSAGGQVIVEPTTVTDLGRMAFCVDPTGAAFGLWQAGVHRGFGIYNEPGSVAWNDLMTRDLATAREFYGAVFGYQFQETGPGYVTFSVPGSGPVGGIHQADELADDVPASWLVHFCVADRDSSAQIAQELGAQILMTMDTPFGPEALMQGKHGEVFSLIELIGQ